MRGALRSGGALCAGLALAAVIGAGGFALQTTLRRPSPADRIAVRALLQLERLAGAHSMVALRGERREAAFCTPWRGRELVRLGPEERLAVAGVHVHQLGRRTDRPVELAAEADLAACPHLLAAELDGLLRSPVPLQVVSLRWHGRPAYAIRLSAIVRLYVAREGFGPLGVSFVSRSLVGRSAVLRTWINPSRRRSAAGRA